MRVIVYKTMLDSDGRCELVKEKTVNYAGERKMDQPDKVYWMLRDVFQMDRQTEEYSYLLCLDSGCKLLGVFELTHGTVNLTLISTRKIFQKALFCNASRIIVAHNHTSGEVTPSSQDISVYKTIKQAASIMGVPLLDSIIVGKSFYSFQEHEAS